MIRESGFIRRGGRNGSRTVKCDAIQFEDTRSTGWGL
jgi:hypothetical protein